MRAAALAVLLALPAAPAAAAKTLVIGSKNFTENRLLAEAMAQLVEARLKIPVERRINLGGTKVVFSALTSGEIDLYPEYTGTAWTVHLKIEEPVRDPLQAFLRVQRESRRRFGLEWLTPFGFNNTYAMAMRVEAAERLGITRISQLKGHERELRLGVNHEFLNRPDGYPGLSKAYGLRFAGLKGMEHGLAYEAIKKGQLDVIDTWSTDGKLLRYPIRVLEDDRRFFPPYDAAPVVRADALERFPGLRAVLTELGFVIDDERMRRLNFRVEEEGGAFEEVARAFLVEEGLLEGAGRAAEVGRERPGLLGFLWSRRQETLRLVGEHLTLTAVAVLLAVLFAVPVGIWLTRREGWTPAVMGMAGTIQTVPSLALLAFMIPVPGLGLGARSAIAALFLYALLPILRNTYTGIKETDPELIEAAQGMGLTDRQLLLRVELPLATRTLMAGIRTSTVISIGVATLAAFIGAGGLGDPIVTGLQLADTRMILSGAIPAALLALAADWLMGRLERFLAPRGLEP